MLTAPFCSRGFGVGFSGYLNTEPNRVFGALGHCHLSFFGLCSFGRRNTLNLWSHVAMAQATPTEPEQEVWDWDNCAGDGFGSKDLWNFKKWSLKKKGAAVVLWKLWSVLVNFMICFRVTIYVHIYIYTGLLFFSINCTQVVSSNGSWWPIYSSPSWVVILLGQCVA